MAISYIVGNRAARPFAQWGPVLPVTPTVSPVYLRGGGHHLAEVFMGEITRGTPFGQGQLQLHVRTNYYRGSNNPPPATASGVWTGGISDCMAVGAAYYNAGQWTHFWFQHVPGGDYNAIVAEIIQGLAACPNVAGRFGFIAAGASAGCDAIATQLTNGGIPANNVSIYVSGTGSRGFAFGVNFANGAFGEVTHTGGELPLNWQF